MKKKKIETRVHLKNFVSMVKTQFQKKIKIIRTDNGLNLTCYNSLTLKESFTKLAAQKCPYKIIWLKEKTNTS